MRAALTPHPYSLAFHLHRIRPDVSREVVSTRMASVLVVEDNDDVREMMAVTLELEGHHVATAVNGRDALEKLHHGERPCVILLDLMMPVMNGWEFRRALELDPELCDVPVVVVSAATGEMARRAHAAAHLPKPLDMDQLLDIVGTLCGDGQDGGCH